MHRCNTLLRPAMRSRYERVPCPDEIPKPPLRSLHMLNLWRLEGGFLDVLKTNPLPQHAAREIRQENEREALFRAPHS
jgi:hypothetical protein